VILEELWSAEVERCRRGLRGLLISSFNSLAEIRLFNLSLIFAVDTAREIFPIFPEFFTESTRLFSKPDETDSSVLITTDFEFPVETLSFLLSPRGEFAFAIGLGVVVGVVAFLVGILEEKTDKGISAEPVKVVIVRFACFGVVSEGTPSELVLL